MKETKYTVKYTTSFKKDYKRAIKRGLKIELLEQVVALLAMGEPLPDKNRDHDLSGDWAGHLPLGLIHRCPYLVRNIHKLVMPVVGIHPPQIDCFHRLTS